MFVQRCKPTSFQRLLICSLRVKTDNKMEKVLLFITVASAPCIISSPFSREYHFIHELKTWTEAQSYCREIFSDLAAIRTMEDVTILNNMVDRNQMTYQFHPEIAWIGLYDDVNSWRWSISSSGFYQTGEELFRNWKSGEPNNMYSRERCGAISSDEVWMDVPCSLTLKPLCLDVSGTSGTFVLINSDMTWTAAQSYCRKHHSDLASVRNMTENHKLHELVPIGGKVWIGLYRDAWKWSDGSDFSLSYWTGAEPNNNMGKENCVAADFGDSGKWDDWDCDLKKAFICYSTFVSKKVLVLKLEKTSLLDLTDPSVMEDLLSQLKQKLKKEGRNEDIELSWRKQFDGNVFLKEEKKKQTSV